MSAILTEAREWIGTPYYHQQSTKGIGCDCLGLVRGVWRGCIGPEPAPTPPYLRMRRRGDSALSDTMALYLTEVEIAAARPADVIIYRIRMQEHCAILAEGDVESGSIIHAMAEAGCVVEGPVLPRDPFRAFRFPESF